MADEIVPERTDPASDKTVDSTPPGPTPSDTPEAVGAGARATDPEAGAPDGPGQDAQPDELESGLRDPYAIANPGAPGNPYEGAIPPGYDWPTHGGYLGCLLSLVVSCLVAGFVAWSPVVAIPAPPLIRGLVAVTVIAIVFVSLGRLGWVLGKRFYREYPQPVRRRMQAPPVPPGGSELGGPREPAGTLEEEVRWGPPPH